MHGFVGPEVRIVRASNGEESQSLELRHPRAPDDELRWDGDVRFFAVEVPPEGLQIELHGHDGESLGVFEASGQASLRSRHGRHP